MKFLLSLFILNSLLGAKEFFITPEEYAEQLYHNPRGIGCHLCHGDQGEGKIIAHFKEHNEARSFVGPAINIVSYEEFSKAVNGRKKGMPRYFLTHKEIEALYSYLHYKDEEE